MKCQVIPKSSKDHVELELSRGEQESLHARDQALEVMDPCEEQNIYSVLVAYKACHLERVHSLQAEKPPAVYTRESIDPVQYNSEAIAIVGHANPRKMGSKQHMISVV